MNAGVGLGGWPWPYIEGPWSGPMRGPSPGPYGWKDNVEPSGSGGGGGGGARTGGRVQERELTKSCIAST